MPVVLEGGDTRFWLDNEFNQQTRLESILKPKPWMNFQYVEADPGGKGSADGKGAVDGDAKTNQQQAGVQRRLF
jgi:putative SOS response-associated peptidase YedK